MAAAAECRTWAAWTSSPSDSPRLELQGGGLNRPPPLRLGRRNIAHEPVSSLGDVGAVRPLGAVSKNLIRQISRVRACPSRTRPPGDKECRRKNTCIFSCGGQLTGLLDSRYCFIDYREVRGVPILTPGGPSYKRTSECRKGAAWKRAAPTAFCSPIPVNAESRGAG